MSAHPQVVIPSTRYVLHDLRSVVDDTFSEDVRWGLTKPLKSLPPKYFYDERGSKLFEDICRTPEYYPTRTERALLDRHAASIIQDTGIRLMTELGSGSSAKTETLLDAAVSAADGVHYVPIDVCREMLESASVRLLDRYPELKVTAIAGDYVYGLQRVPNSRAPRLFMFLGGSIGNFEKDEAHNFVATVAHSMDRGDWFLLGADRVKDEEVLNAAYNDNQGVTAAFNLNILRVINRNLGADFRLDQFKHYAYFNSEESQVEMHLRSCKSQTVSIPRLSLVVEFGENEMVRTEISRKFTPSMLDELCTGAGLSIEEHFTPDNEYFSLVLARKN